MYKAFAKFGAVLTMVAASPAFAQNATANPPGSGPINNALGWIQGTLMGNLATTAAVIAVAACGFMMLTGRMNWKFGATVVMGCFVLFGAAAIVAGIQSAAVAG
jgi:type IV secretory pathway VirB2 component (pilin)